MTSRLPRWDVRSLLIPEGELAADLGVLVDPGFDLRGTVDEAGLGEVVDDRSAVGRAIASAGDPADEVIAVAGGEGEDVDELHTRFTGQLHEHVIRLHLFACRAGRRHPRQTRWPASTGLRG